jgi:hypothetical protein
MAISNTESECPESKEPAASMIDVSRETGTINAETFSPGVSNLLGINQKNVLISEFLALPSTHLSSDTRTKGNESKDPREGKRRQARALIR